jgi:Holliday junction resolvase RusA-like endonuclease
MTTAASLPYDPSIEDKVILMSNGRGVPPRLGFVFDTPVVQESMWSHTTWGGGRGGGRPTTCFRDPSKVSKERFKEVVRHAFQEVGVTKFPMYDNPQEVKIFGCFFIKNRVEDLDNLMKHLGGMLEGVVYLKDNCIKGWVMMKEHVDDRQEEHMKITIDPHPLVINLVEPDD